MGTFLIASVLIAYTIVMTSFVTQQGVDLKSLLILYTNIAFICILVQMHVHSRHDLY
tara:strand:+ start:129 stop:299 length:171 start_codon:yes stop_codon:yes gene_type:complete